MKKLLTILILLLMAFVTQGWAATETTLWETGVNEYHTNDGIVLGNEKVATFQMGDVLRVYLTVPDGGGNFGLQYKSEANGWNGTAIPSITGDSPTWPWVSSGNTYYDVLFTDADITALSGQNVYLSHGGSTITKVTYISKSEITLCSNTIPLNATIPASKFANVSAGDVIKFIVASVSATGLNIDIKVAGGDWYTCKTFQSVTGETTYSYQITSTAIDNGLKTHGLSIEKSGGDGTISVSDIKLRTNGEVPADPTLSLNNFEGDNYDKTTHTLTLTEWGSMSLDLGLSTSSQGSKLIFKTSSACNLKMSGTYLDGTNIPTVEESGDGTLNHVLALDENNFVKTIKVETGSTVTFTELALDPTYTLTKSATNGSISVSTDGGTSTTTDTSFGYGTVLTLTATPATGYDFSKWTIDGTDYTDTPHTYTITGNVTATATFSAIKAFTLDNFEQGDDCTYDKSSHQMTTTAGWKGITLTVGDNSTYSGSVLVFKTSEDCQLKLYVSYVSGGSDENIESTTSKIHALTIDKEKKIKDVTVQNQATETITITFTSMALDPTYTVTKSVENGDFTISTDGGSTTTDATTFAYGKELTLTAVPASGYKFVKWKIDGGDAGTDATITHTIIADVTVNPIFEEKAGLLAEGETRLLWFNADGEELTWGSHAAQSAEIGDIVEAGEILIVTAKSVDSSDGHYPKIYLLDASGNEIQIESETVLIDPMVVGENRLTITEAIREKIADGFKFKGCDATITKLELYKPEPIKRLAEEETKTLWSNSEGVALAWNSVTIDRAAEWGAVLEEDERIIITVKTKDSSCEWPTVALANSSGSIGSTANLLNDLTMPAELTITLTAEMVNKMKNGFNITGDGATITKAVLYKPTMPTKTVHTLNSTETAISGDTNVTVAAEKFANISAYDVLTVNFTITTSPANVIIKGNGEDGGWDYLKEMKFENGETLFALPLTPAMTSNLKKNGLQITGSGYTFKSVTIKTAGEVPSDEEKKDDDDEETIIDEKTGEADLTVLSAQDDSKTTLTQNEDGSITMTTTEAYQAAQIWFSDPETVTGNVLKVELAESNVNVTVTVKYTDGTESQMSANTMVAKARGETRSASGTTVEVPLESGKEVQNIEVKNNVAGTITIKKMQVTTVNVFTNGVANLSMLKPQSNATYDTAAHTLATTKGWTGATISPVANENVSGKELLIEFADASKVKVAVKYRTDVEGPSTIMEKAAKAVRLALDNSKNIQEISIQPTEAAIVTFTKIAVNSEETDDGSLKPGKTITLWENAAGETLAWNEVAKQDASVGETLKEYDELLITVSGVTKGCDWPKVFIRDASSEQAGNEVLLNDIASFPYTVRIVLTGEMAQQLSKGFSICGDGVTVKKLQVYRPQAPKTGDIHLADLNYGYNSSYDKGTHTITTTARWAARGWEIGDKRYNDKNLITVKFEPVDFPVTLKMEYTTGLQTAQATSVGVPAGRTELLLEIPSGISKLNRVYIIYENPGSIKLTEASVTYQDNLKLSTAIRSFEADGVIRDGRYDSDGWYNLRGMRIAEPKTSGVYIHGGKKVVIY